MNQRFSGEFYLEPLGFMKSAPGRKVSKDRLTFMPCSNATGTHKRPLLVLGKAQNPRAFKNAHLPIFYKGTTKGWMTKTVFFDWFKQSFIPNVKKFLKEVNLPQKALLLIDNAPSHPPEDDIQHVDPNFRVLFLPPNCTALLPITLLQPMDQNLIQNIKVSYRKNLLHYISHKDNNMVQLLKSFNLKDAVLYLERAWKSITEKNICRSGHQLWSSSEDEDNEENISLAELKRKLLSPLVADLNELTESLHFIDPDNNLTSNQIKEWALGENKTVDCDLTDKQIVQETLNNDPGDEESKSEFVEEENNPRSQHAAAVEAFKVCDQWAEENNVDLKDILLLRTLTEMAANCIT
jgi:hypothetical protein